MGRMAETALKRKLLSDSLCYLYRFERRMITFFLRNLLRKNSLMNSLVLPRLKLTCMTSMETETYTYIFEQLNKITRKTKLIKLSITNITNI
jgi:Cdc6-like AAA superfamily ATPase